MIPSLLAISNCYIGRGRANREQTKVSYTGAEERAPKYCTTWMAWHRDKIVSHASSDSSCLPLYRSRLHHLPSVGRRQSRESDMSEGRSLTGQMAHNAPGLSITERCLAGNPGYGV